MITYEEAYTYDASTNLLAWRHSQNGTTQERTQPVRARNNRQRLYTYDEAGNQLRTDALDQLCYGADGQVCSIEWQQGGYKMREDYTYLQPGVRARKITRTWNAAGVLVGLETTTYIGQVEKRASYRGANLSYDGDTCTGYTTQHRWTVTRIKEGHGQVGTLTKNEETGEETVSYHALNHLDSNELVVDEAGNVIRYASYLPYGETQEVLEASEDAKSELGYSGQEQDATGLYYYGYRYLQGSSGLWNRADPIRFASGQWNLYGMLEGNPVRGRDEMGLINWQLLLSGFVKQSKAEESYKKALGNYYDVNQTPRMPLDMLEHYLMETVRGAAMNKLFALILKSNVYKLHVPGRVTELTPEQADEAGFMLKEHAVILRNRLRDQIVSVRNTGKYSLKRLALGNPAKGHEVLEKSIKPKSLNKFGLEKDNYERYLGLVSHGMNDQGIKGVWAFDPLQKHNVVVPFTNTKKPSLDFAQTYHPSSEGKDPNYDNAYYQSPISKETLIKTVYTGDYDMHDAFLKHKKASDTQPLEKLNRVLLAQASKQYKHKHTGRWEQVQQTWRSPENTLSSPFSVIRHGNQTSFFDFLASKAGTKELHHFKAWLNNTKNLDKHEQLLGRYFQDYVIAKVKYQQLELVQGRLVDHQFNNMNTYVNTKDKKEKAKAKKLALGYIRAKKMLSEQKRLAEQLLLERLENIRHVSLLPLEHAVMNIDSDIAVFTPNRKIHRLQGVPNIAKFYFRTALPGFQGNINTPKNHRYTLLYQIPEYFVNDMRKKLQDHSQLVRLNRQVVRLNEYLKYRQRLCPPKKHQGGGVNSGGAVDISQIKWPHKIKMDQMIGSKHLGN
ncbi:RHS repeat-associated core domain-containing protein [uncultured Microscilla sp.]|uniref:RHS repeat domain-containing protein n=1 Tax=uncultured Microscilla sp. TaxID=432653 RepID=UPI002629C7CD|nr:RHS repeat-associated core domain-containing protein [uncultured Microscilla sp.]